VFLFITHFGQFDYYTLDAPDNVINVIFHFQLISKHNIICSYNFEYIFFNFKPIPLLTYQFFLFFFSPRHSRQHPTGVPDRFRSPGNRESGIRAQNYLKFSWNEQ
jgi:hypothetical protein